MKRQWKWLWPFAFLALLAPFTPKLDLWISSLFHRGGNEFYNSALFQFFYVWGELFGLFVGFVALAVFLLSYLVGRWKVWRRGALAVLLTLAIGAGVIINLGFKGYWGRPRPKQIVQFGGKQEYRAFWRPAFGQVGGDHQKSFPSGHAAVGFFYLSLILVGRRYRSRLVTNSGVLLTGFWGSGLMVTRVVQGAHFVSDVVTSPVIMWSVALLVDRLVFETKASTWLEGAEA